ncbi:MAG TPA: tripartite tricarboxylate transporter substrate binding protein [Casimicrobiaceae bacterium]|nr:tripartite tricarboxylate transporter substrate binding protein [Casimicrobiaceae bacterium]
MQRILAWLIRGIALAALATVASAQTTMSYPSKPIRLIVPFPPGAGTDTVARFVATKLGESMNATIVIDNRTGAGGAIGAAEASKADPDGYTLLFVASPFTTVAASTKAPGYDPIRNFVPVASIASGPLAFVVNPTVPASTMREFIAWARQNPGRINYGSAGPGSVNHLALELFMARTGTEIVHVPYRGIADATKDLLGGQLQAMTASIPATLPQLADKRVRVLAVTGDRRIPQIPDAPSWQEEGVTDANVINYWGVVAPAGTPAEIVRKLNSEIQKVLAQPDVRARLEREGAELVSGPPERLGIIIERDLTSWRKLITEARIALQ